MDNLVNIDGVLSVAREFIAQPNALRAVFIVAFVIVLAYFASNLIARLIIKIAQKVAVRSDVESDEVKHMLYRQTETYLSVAVAAVRAVIVALAAYFAWSLVSPHTTNEFAAIGASAVFIVFAGQTVGVLLKDITSGTTMIIEKWFHIGDFVKFEPFLDVSGVVERMTLRSTKIRRLSGEVVWIHNQQIQAAHVTPKGVRTLAVDIFVSDLARGKDEIKQVIRSIPTGPMMIARPLKIEYTEKWRDDLWRITVTGQTLPGREWLIETYFADALRDIDEGIADKSKRVLVRKPIVRYADSVADSRFKRAVRVKREQ